MEERVAILTSFREFVPGYSLTGIVLDQARLLARGGHPVDVFVCQDYTPQLDGSLSWWGSGSIKLKMPQAKLIDYKSRADLTEEHKEVILQTTRMCREELVKYKYILTHDLVFTGWNLPYGQGICLASQDMPEQRWLHWIHSIPSGFKEFWNFREFGHRHRVIYPNRSDVPLVAAQFRAEEEFVRVIPHPKDLRSWFDYDPLTWGFIDDYPGLMQADVVQVYPAGTDRLEAKRVDVVIQLFSEFKKLGRSVCLVIANQWATGRQRKEDIVHYHKIVRRHGLSNEEVIFSSDWREGEFEKGLPKRMLRELFQCSNLFIFPTREETFGLVLPEAVLSGGVLPVLNRSLPMMLEVSGMNALYVDFGSYCQHIPPPPTGWHREVAKIILGRMDRDESLKMKTFVRQKYNLDHLYKRYYAPILAESALW